MKRMKLVFALMVSLLVMPLPAGVESAQEETVLIVNGPGEPGFLGIRANATNTLQRLIENRGFGVRVSAEVPGDLSGFQCIFDIRFAENAAITAAEAAAYVEYLAGGGRLYVTGENGKFGVRNSSVIALVEAAGGGRLQFCEPATGGLFRVSRPDCVDGFLCSTPNSIGEVEVALPGGTAGSGSGTPVLATEDAGGQECDIASVWRPGQMMNALAGRLMVMFDVDILTRRLPDLGNDNLALVDNLVTFLCGPNDPPVAVCREVVKAADEACEAAVTAEEVDGGSFDPNGDPIRLSLSPAGPYPLGTTEVRLTVTDDQSLSASCQARVRVVDETPPAVDCPADVEVECSGPEGAVVEFPAPGVSDNCDADPVVEYTPASGSLLPLGVTPVECRVTDASGNSTSCRFNVNVVDTTPPEIKCEDVEAECSGPEGAAVTFRMGVSDGCDPSPRVEYTPASGSVFPLGATTVECRATDASGNSSSCTFTVTVVDTTAPTITCPADITAECTSPEGAVITFTATATDGCDPNPTVVSEPPSGSTFPPGTTAVVCRATDASGNSSSCRFTVTVVDTTPPTLNCADITAECGSPNGTVVNFTPQVTDNCDPTPTVVSEPPSGSTFLPGTTVVTCTATDASGNSSSCSFRVTVVDTTPPTISCADMTVECTSPAGAVVNFTPQVTDNCDANPVVVCTPASGSQFPMGSTTVTCVATDVNGHSASCSFTVTVVDTTPPEITCPADITVECAGPAGTVVTFAVTATDTCDVNPVVVSTPPSGSVFPLGTTTVVCRASDAGGNSSSCSFRVTVVDTTPPEISCPPAQTVLCSRPEGAVVTIPAVASDTCDANPVVVCVPASGSVFPLGTTTVVCTATDASGNSASCTTTVTVFNNPPVAEAGTDQAVDEGSVVELMGSGSDPDVGQSVSFQWRQTGGQAVTLTGSHEATARFEAPEVPVGNCEVLRFELTVIDACGATARDTVQVRVRDRIEGVDSKTGNCVKITLTCDREMPTSGVYCWKTGDGRVFSGAVVISRQKSVFGRLTALHIETLPGDENRLRLNVDQPRKGIIAGQLSVPREGGFGRRVLSLQDFDRQSSRCECP